MSDGAKTERQIEILSKSKLEDCLKYENKIALELLWVISVSENFVLKKLEFLK